MTITRLASKKNSVYLIDENGKTYIKKVFINANSFDNEVKILTKLQAFNVPKILKIYDLTIEMQYIDGQTLIDYLNQPFADLALAANGLADFLIVFDQKFQGLMLSDLNFHNFIISNNSLYAIDFEKTKNGTLNQAVARVAAFATRDLPNPKSDTFIRSLLKNTNIPYDAIKNDTAKYLKYLKRRKNAVR